jgi:P27 family predicted phage terminase small subunit
MKAKPIEQHKLDGTYRPDRHEVAITHIPLSHIPQPPAMYKKNKTLLNIYNDHAKILLDKDLLFQEDLPVLQSFCSAIYIRDKALESLLNDGVLYNHEQDRGSTNLAEHPAWKIHKSASELILRLSQKIGFNLYDKNKIQIPSKPKDVKDPIMKALE